MAEGLFSRLSETESEISRLMVDVEGLNSLLNCGYAVKSDSELFSLHSSNAKLQYQIKHLSESILTEKERGMKYMTNVYSVVNGIFSATIRRLYPDFNKLKNTLQPEAKFGDYKSTVALQIAQMLKSQGCPKAPRDIAECIASNLEFSKAFFEKCDVAGPGFINISLKPSYVSELVSRLLVRGIQPPPVDRKLRVVVDFSSPNIAKEMHVGHLRSTIIGETICRVLEFAGHDVLRLNHVGDWGTQFGMLIAHLCDKFPDYKQVSPPISDLQTFYKESKERFGSDEDFKKKAYSCVVRLQSGDDEIVAAWKLICNVSRREFDNIYKRLQVNIIERGESFYQSMMQDVIEDLQSKGLVEEDNGRKVVFVEDSQVPLTIQKSDGAFTYDTSDVAALRHRVQDERGDWLIYVVDSGQALHFQTVFAVGQKAGYLPENVRVDHVTFGVVLGEDKKKFRSRSGDTVRLVDLLDEGQQRARNKLAEKNRLTALGQEEVEATVRSVAYGCIKYADLSQTRTNDYVFSFDKMLDDRGNTAVYLLYTYTRIRSIARLANVGTEQLRAAAVTTPIEVAHEKELKLSKCIIRFPEVISRVCDGLYPHVLCDYLYELCTTFTEFYENCYCVEKDRVTGQIIKINTSRLLLCEAAALVMEKSFYILGIEPVLRM